MGRTGLCCRVCTGLLAALAGAQTYTASPPLTITAKNIAIPKATGAIDGYLAHSDLLTLATLGGNNTFSGTLSFTKGGTYSGGFQVVSGAASGTYLSLVDTGTSGYNYQLLSGGSGSAVPGEFALVNSSLTKTFWVVESATGNWRLIAGACLAWTANAQYADQGTGDTLLCRPGTGPATTLTDTNLYLIGRSAYAAAPACTSALEGSAWAFTDSSTAAFGAVIAGGGSNHMRGHCNGTNWVVM